jgi:uncharacterized protein with FMN-binding domain
MRLTFILLFFVLFVLGSFSDEGCPEIKAAPAQEKPKNIHDEVERVKNLEISDVDISSVPDGEYIGEIPFMSYIYRVKVKVESGKMKDIEVLDNGTGNSYAEQALEVVPRMMEEQTPKVDAVTGATVTSKALMKCVEKALTQNK